MGDFSRGGMTRGDNRASDHDFGWEAQYIPCGIVDEDSAALHITFGSSYKTSDFIVDAIEAKWNTLEVGCLKMLFSGHFCYSEFSPRHPFTPTQYLGQLIGFSAYLW